jgi:hypothetical protein
MKSMDFFDNEKSSIVKPKAGKSLGKKQVIRI